MSVPQVLRQVFAAGATADRIRVQTRALAGGDHVEARLVELQEQAQQASTPEAVLDLLGQAAEYARAAQ